MTASSPEPHGPGHAEQPTTAALVTIDRGAWVKLSAWRWLTGEGNVPSGAAHYFITMLGVVTCVVSGIGGAVLTPGSGPGRTPVVFAELVLALVGAVLFVAAGHFDREAPDADQAPQDPGKPAEAREQTEVR